MLDSSQSSDTARLGDLGDVQGGIGTGRIESDAPRTGRLALGVQITAIASGTLDWSHLKPIDPKGPIERYTVKPDDLLFALRAPLAFTRIAPLPDDWMERLETSVRRRLLERTAPEDVEGTVQPRLVVIGPTALFRANPNLTSPGYIDWIFHQGATRYQANKLAKGNTILQFISIKDLRQLEIPLPDLETQRKIAHIWTLQQRVLELEHKRLAAEQEHARGLLQALTNLQSRPHHLQHKAH